jgi:hypothetical protein
MDIGEIFPLRVGMLGEIAHARPVDCDAVGKIPEGDAHGLDAIAHRQEPLDVVVGDDDGHVWLRSLAPFSTRGQPISGLPALAMSARPARLGVNPSPPERTTP